MNSYITRELFQRGLEITLNSTAWQKLWTTTRNISDSHWGILFSPSYLYVHWLANHTKAYTMCINHIQEELLVFWSLEAQASTVLTFQTVQWIFHKLRNVSLKARKSQEEWSHITFIFICSSGRCVWVLFLFYYLPFLPFPELVCALYTRATHSTPWWEKALFRCLPGLPRLGTRILTASAT